MRSERDPTGWRPFAARRLRRERMDAAIESLERSAAAAEAERARLAEAVAVSHRALAVLHDGLAELVERPARVDAQVRALVEHARAELAAAADRVAKAASERVATDIAPARRAAEEHAAYMRCSLDRIRGEADALAGAQDAAATLVALAGTAQAGLAANLEALGRRSDQAVDAAERAAARLEAVVARLEQPRRRAAAR